MKDWAIAFIQAVALVAFIVLVIRALMSYLR